MNQAQIFAQDTLDAILIVNMIETVAVAILIVMVAYIVIRVKERGEQP